MSTLPTQTATSGLLSRQWIAANLTVFASSFCVMVVELVAARLTSRYLGHSLYTWTSVFGVILAGISLGNMAGGRIADRFASARTLAFLFLAAAAGCLAVLPLNRLVGEWTVLHGLSWPVRILIHMTAVFLLPAALLGTISPVIARRALLIGKGVGKTMGNVYAAAIAGSIVGTFATGFYLLSYFSYPTVIFASAGFLSAIGITYGLLGRDRLAGGYIERESASILPASSSLLLPIATVFISNAAILATELTASRMLARYFGQTLHSWTAVIGTALLGMTLGSYFGGRLADRFGARPMLAPLFVLSAISTLSVLSLNKIFGLAGRAEWMAWEWHIAMHCILTFFLPFAMLGAITPVVAAWALEKGHPKGATIGQIYAWSSIGSLAGTFVTGYLLIDLLGAAGVIGAVVVLISLIALAFAPKSRLAWAWGGVCAVVIASALMTAPALQAPAVVLSLREQPRPENLYRDDSQYSYVRVDAHPRMPELRMMVLDKLIHSKVDITEPTHLKYTYEWAYDGVLAHDSPGNQPITAMVIGGGGFTFPRYLELTRPGSYVDVSEIDAAVTEAAHAVFGLPRDTSLDIFNMDARNHVTDLVRRKKQGLDVPAFDYIFGDSINDFSVPYHLTTREFVEDLRYLMKPDGIYLLNLIDTFDSAEFLSAVVNTNRTVFEHVDVLTAREPRFGRDTFVVVSSDRIVELEPAMDYVRSTYNFEWSPLSEEELRHMAERTRGIVLTDDFAPVDNLLGPVLTGSKIPAYTSTLTQARDRLADGDIAGAKGLLDEVRAEAPGDPDLMTLYGAVLLAEGNPAAAIETLRRSLGVAPNSPVTWLQLGDAYEALGEQAEAIAAWKSAIARGEASPEDQIGLPSVHVKVAMALAESDHSTEALNHAEKAVRLAPGLSQAHEALAFVRFQRGEFRRAVEAQVTAVALQPGKLDAQVRLAQLQWRAQDFDGAWATVETIRDRGGEVSADFLAALQRSSGRTD